MHSEIKSTRIRSDDAQRWGFSVMASIDNPKASKATAYGYLNAILYMAPSDSAGVGENADEGDGSLVRSRRAVHPSLQPTERLLIHLYRGDRLGDQIGKSSCFNPKAPVYIERRCQPQSR